jgi:hypothetical protein
MTPTQEVAGDISQQLRLMKSTLESAAELLQDVEEQMPNGHWRVVHERPIAFKNALRCVDSMIHDSDRAIEILDREADGKRYKAEPRYNPLTGTFEEEPDEEPEE